MYLEDLSLINFRNLEKTKLSFNPGVNVFFGDNAQGKTNLLEAIFLLSTTKSFRTRIDHQLINWAQEQAKVVGKADHLNIELVIKPNGKKLTVNKQNKKAVEIFGSLLTVIFTPADIEIVAGSPDTRRRFLDHLGSSLSREYLKSLINLQKVIRSRNQTLFLLRERRSADLWVWDQQLTKLALFIWEEREKLVEELNSQLKILGKKLLNAQLKIEYHFPLETSRSRKEREKDFLKRLEALKGEEIRRAQTLLGPQRDDFKTIIEKEEVEKIVSKDLGIYGSRGEQRAATLALKLSEVEVIAKDRGFKPLLLLDEVLSELDENHRKLLLSNLKGQQVFITTTSLESVTSIIGNRVKQFKVVEGKVQEPR